MPVSTAPVSRSEQTWGVISWLLRLRPLGLGSRLILMLRLRPLGRGSRLILGRGLPLRLHSCLGGPLHRSRTSAPLQLGADATVSLEVARYSTSVVCVVAMVSPASLLVAMGGPGAASSSTSAEYAMATEAPAGTQAVTTRGNFSMYVASAVVPVQVDQVVLPA